MFVDEGSETGGSSVFVAVNTYFVAATRDEAVKAREAHVMPRREARDKESAREQEKRRREAEWKVVKPQHIEIAVRRKTPVMEALSDWDQDLIKWATGCSAKSGRSRCVNPASCVAYADAIRTNARRGDLGSRFTHTPTMSSCRSI